MGVFQELGDQRELVVRLVVDRDHPGVGPGQEGRHLPVRHVRQQVHAVGDTDLDRPGPQRLGGRVVRRRVERDQRDVHAVELRQRLDHQLDAAGGVHSAAVDQQRRPRVDAAQGAEVHAVVERASRPAGAAR